MESKEAKLVSGEEQDLIERKLLYAIGEIVSDVPVRLYYEDLDTGVPNIALGIIQGAYKVPGGEDILGGYEAQVQFKVIYKAQPKTNDTRLAMDEYLNQVGYRLEKYKLDLGAGRVFRKIQLNARSAYFDRDDSGDEIHQILMTMFYEVI